MSSVIMHIITITVIITITYIIGDKCGYTRGWNQACDRFIKRGRMYD